MYNKSEIMKEAKRIEKMMKTKKYFIVPGDSYRARAMREAWATAKMELSFAFCWKNVNGEAVKVETECRFRAA